MLPSILTPAAVLVVWSLVVMVWMMGSRFHAFREAQIDLQNSPPGGRGQDLEGRISARANWKAHNYAHLMEQPTLFYATVFILAMSGASGFDIALAWSYVLVRIAHSVWQGTVNRIPMRFGLFFVSSLFLTILAVRALAATIATPLAVM